MTPDGAHPLPKVIKRQGEVFLLKAQGCLWLAKLTYNYWEKSGHRMKVFSNHLWLCIDHLVFVD